MITFHLGQESRENKPHLLSMNTYIKPLDFL